MCDVELGKVAESQTLVRLGKEFVAGASEIVGPELGEPADGAMTFQAFDPLQIVPGIFRLSRSVGGEVVGGRQREVPTVDVLDESEPEREVAVVHNSGVRVFVEVTLEDGAARPSFS